jgi:hypothetical protein
MVFAVVKVIPRLIIFFLLRFNLPILIPATVSHAFNLSVVRRCYSLEADSVVK